MRFINKEDFEISRTSPLFEVGSKNVGENQVSYKAESREANEKDSAKNAIKSQLEDLKMTADPKNWPMDKQLDMLRKLAKNEAILDDDINSKNLIKTFSSWLDQRDVSDIVTKLSDEALLKFVTLHKKDALELFSDQDKNVRTINFFDINFLERNISALELFSSEEKYLCMKGAFRGDTYFIRQAEGYLQVKPKTEEKKYAHIGSGTELQILSEKDFKDNVSQNLIPNLDDDEKVQEKEKSQIRNLQFYQSIKLSFYEIRDKHPEYVDGDKLEKMLLELDSFYQSDKCKNPQKFNFTIIEKVEKNLEGVFKKELKFDVARGCVLDYLGKIEEHKDQLLDYNRNQVLEYLKSVNPEANAEAHIDALFEKIDNAQISEENLKNDLVEISLSLGVKSGKEQKKFVEDLVQFIKGRRTSLLQNHSNELFIKTSKIKLEQTRILEIKKNIQAKIAEQNQQIFQFYQDNQAFCQKLNFANQNEFLSADTEKILENKKNFFQGRSTDVQDHEAFFLELHNLIEIKGKTQNEINALKKEEAALGMKIGLLKIELEDLKASWESKNQKLEAQENVFIVIEKSIGTKRDFFESVSETYKVEKQKRDEEKKNFYNKYGEKIINQSPEIIQKQEVFVQNFIAGNPPGINVVRFNEEGPVITIGEDKKEAQYHIATGEFSVIGIKDYNADYLRFPAKPESIPKLQIVAALKDANYFTSDATIAKDAKILGPWELEDFLNNYLGFFNGNRILHPNETDGWKNVVIEARKRGKGLLSVMENLGVLNKHKALDSKKGNVVRPQLNYLLEAARVGNKDFLDRFFGTNQ